MNKKIFITGASGFVGSSLSQYQKKKKLKLEKVVFKNTTSKKNKKIDLTKKFLIKKKFDWVVHIAAHHKIEDFKKRANLKAKRNILMVKNILAFSKFNKIEKIIFFSTIDINYSPYPNQKKIYIKSKLYCEKILLNAYKNKLLKKIIILRLPAIVGKKSGNHFIKKSLYNLKNNLPVNIWNMNKNYNNLIHVDDLNKLIFHCIRSKKKGKHIIDCISSNPIKLYQLIANLKKKLKSKSKITCINKKNEYKKIKFNQKIDYKFFSVKRATNLLL